MVDLQLFQGKVPLVKIQLVCCTQECLLADNHKEMFEHCVQAMRNCWGMVEQARSYYVDWRMLRDLKRRQMAFEYADERLRINALRKNTILPKELQVQWNVWLHLHSNSVSSVPLIVENLSHVWCKAVVFQLVQFILRPLLLKLYCKSQIYSKIFAGGGR